MKSIKDTGFFSCRSLDHASIVISDDKAPSPRLLFTVKRSIRVEFEGSYWWLAPFLSLNIFRQRLIRSRFQKSISLKGGDVCYFWEY